MIMMIVLLCESKVRCKRLPEKILDLLFSSLDELLLKCFNEYTKKNISWSVI